MIRASAFGTFVWEHGSGKAAAPIPRRRQLPGSCKLMLPTRLPARQHPTLPDIRHTRPGSNGKHNERHQRMGRRDQGSSTTTTGTGSSPRAQPIPFANRAGCSDAADWQCNPAGAGRGFIRIVYFISQIPIPNSQIPIPKFQIRFSISLFPFSFFGFMDRPLPPPRSVP